MKLVIIKIINTYAYALKSMHFTKSKSATTFAPVLDEFPHHQQLEPILELESSRNLLDVDIFSYKFTNTFNNKLKCSKNARTSQ